MSKLIDVGKRTLITATGLAIAGGVFARQFIRPLRAAEEEKDMGEKLKEMVTGENEEEVTPPEDLMREHGVLNRVLLIYEAVLQKFGSNAEFDPAVLTNAAQIVRDFIENYHEKSEEEQVFPRFKQAGQMVDVVDTLIDQHQAGRRLTDLILKCAPSARKGEDARRQTVGAMQAFIRMYRPHEAREDTEVFPKLRKLVSSNEYDVMAEDFEKKEHALFGEDGFELMVDRVAKLEKTIGINDIKQFTPK